MYAISSKASWTNWAGTVQSEPADFLNPASIEEVQMLVLRAKEERRSIRVIGAGHSFTPIAATSDWLVSLDQLTGVVEITDQGTVEVLAGTRLYDLAAQLNKVGLAQENLGDINTQSIAGAISTGTHGTGIEFGNLSSQIVELTLVTASGVLLTLTPEHHPVLFYASLVSLGTLGIIVSVRLRTVERPIYHYESTKMAFDSLIPQIGKLIKENRHFECFLFPYSDSVQLKKMNESTEKPQRLATHRLATTLTENYMFYFISELCRMRPQTSRFFSRLSAKAIGTTSIHAASVDLFATPRLVRFREMEYAIPLEHLQKALVRIKRVIEDSNFGVHFPIEVRMVKGDKIWLSLHIIVILLISPFICT